MRSNPAVIMMTKTTVKILAVMAIIIIATSMATGCLYCSAKEPTYEKITGTVESVKRTGDSVLIKLVDGREFDFYTTITAIASFTSWPEENILVKNLSVLKGIEEKKMYEWELSRNGYDCSRGRIPRVLTNMTEVRTNPV